jgi:hypothetical protein
MSYQFDNAQNWQEFYSQNFFAQQLTANRFQPIPEITVPILLDSHVITVYVASASAKETWQFAGFLNQRFAVSVTLGGSYDANVISKRKLWLNKNTLLIFRKITDYYAVSIEIPKWFKDAYVVFWKYIGPVPVENWDLTEVLASLSQIEQKVNTILTLEGQ